MLGKPIPVPRIADPDHGTVDKYLNTFIDAMSALVEEHKANAGACHAFLLRFASRDLRGCASSLNVTATGMPDNLDACLSGRVRGHAAHHQMMLQFRIVEFLSRFIA